MNLRMVTSRINLKLKMLYYWLYTGTSKSIFMLQQLNSGLGCLIVELFRSHIHRHTHLIELLWTSDQSIAEAVPYTTHNEHTRRTFVPSAGFEHAIPAIKRPQTYALDRTATIGSKSIKNAQVRSRLNEFYSYIKGYRVENQSKQDSFLYL